MVKCNGIVTYSKNLSSEEKDCFRLSIKEFKLKILPIEFVFCIFDEKYCPKSRNKCRITQSCWTLKKYKGA